MDAYRVDVDADCSVVRVTCFGELTQAVGEEIITTARTVAAEHGYGILYDMRQATINVMLADWFYLPRKLDVLKQASTRRVKVAILVNPGGEEEKKYTFYEVVAQNTGLIVRRFTSEAEALEWL